MFTGLDSSLGSSHQRGDFMSGRKQEQRLRPAALAAAVALAWAVPAHAFEIDTGNPDIKLRFDNQVRYVVGVRGEKINPAFGNSPTYDETEYKFDKGDVMTNRFDLLSEFDVSYKEKFGGRVSAAAWKDFAYNGKAERNPSLPFPGSYANDEYTSTTKRFYRQGGELLDAFVFGNFDLGVPLKVRLGKHTVYWGEAMFTPFHGISYSQAPLDGLKGASSPGIEAKEIFMPVNQISLSTQLTSQLTLNAQYFLAWRPNRLPQGGTYFGSADMLFDGPQFIFAGAAGNVPRGPSVEPKRSSTDNFGVNLRYSPSAMAGTAFGLYYRKFDETQPWAPVFALGAGGLVNYHLAYAKNTEMLAGSVSTSVGPVAVGSELIYRKNAALVSGTNFAAVGDLAGTEGARGNTWHFLVNGVYLLPKTPLWDSGTLLGEFIYSKLDKITKNAAVYKGVGSPACTNVLQLAGQGTERDGCSTGKYAQIQIGFTPQWLAVAPSLDLSMPVSFTYGFLGNGPTLGPNFKGARAWSIGLDLDYQQKYKLSFKWSDAWARYTTGPTGVVGTSSGNAAANNKGLFTVAFKTSF
jgi:hypothetical protein